MKKIWKRIIFTGISILLIHLFMIVLFGFLSEAKSSDFIIILGNKVEMTGQPSKRLAYRLDKGFELYQKGLAPNIIVSGGIGKEGFDEAKVMVEYLINKGVDSSAIIQDNQGLTTFASAQNSERILEQHNTTSIIIVSQYFHLLRSNIAFHFIGIPNVSVEAADYFFEWRDFYSMFREIPGIYYYLIRSCKTE